MGRNRKKSTTFISIGDDEMDPKTSFSTSKPRFYDPDNRFSLTGGVGGSGGGGEEEKCNVCTTQYNIWLEPLGNALQTRLQWRQPRLLAQVFYIRVCEQQVTASNRVCKRRWLGEERSRMAGIACSVVRGHGPLLRDLDIRA